jgi:hypothetical protein
VCQNFGKREFVGINGMLIFLFFGRSTTILIRGLSRSWFTNPKVDNLKWDALKEI